MLAASVRTSAVSLLALALAMGVQGASEGKRMMTDYAQAVVDNKQEVLPVPWEILKNMDSAWIGGYSVKDSAKCEVKVGSLNTTREQQGVSPNLVIGSVVVKETQACASPPANSRMGAKGGMEVKHLNGVVNPTSELTLVGWQRIRWAAAKEWLEYWAGRYAGKLMLLHSNGDIVYAGCTENEIIKKYQTVIDANGGTQTIVMAAEVSPNPSASGWMYQKTSWTEGRLTTALQSLGVPLDWASQYADCSNSTLCNVPAPKYQFANSGFVMGPAIELLEMFSDLDSYSGPENRLVSDYYIRNPDKVALDFSGELVLSLHNMVKDDGIPVEVTTDSGGAKKLTNKVTKKDVCFVHGNGNSLMATKVLAQDLL